MNGRILQPEWLDILPASDVRAQRSRRDLRRVNAWMGNAACVAGALREGAPARRIVELGAGDGTFLLAVASRLGSRGRNVEARLVDRQPLLSRDTAARFEALGWSVQAVEADVFEWLESSPADAADVVVANLFLHHFQAEQLRRMLELIAGRTRWLVACEPARSAVALAGVRLLRLIGCNGVTRHDAWVSVRAGFTGTELSTRWPARGGWELREGPAGWCSHWFQARRDG